jgi:sigma-B regulation protein RsbU (phosphoserine phosphatase)
VYDPDPAAVLHNLNRVLYQEYRHDARYCTVVFGVLTLLGSGAPPPSAGFRAVVASGGHPQPLLLRADGTAGHHSTKGRIVGVFPDSVYTNTVLTVRPGDTLMLYTDGITEARIGGERFGVEGLIRFARETAPTTAPSVVGAFTDLLDNLGGGLEDDIAVMALSAPAADEENVPGN